VILVNHYLYLDCDVPRACFGGNALHCLSRYAHPSQRVTDCSACVSVAYVSLPLNTPGKDLVYGLYGMQGTQTEHRPRVGRLDRSMSVGKEGEMGQPRFPSHI
jgi:hypothetical protein